MEPYHCYIDDTDISYPENKNDLAKKPANKPANKEISLLFDHSKP